jgi:hypothetical protein
MMSGGGDLFLKKSGTAAEDFQKWLGPGLAIPEKYPPIEVPPAMMNEYEPVRQSPQNIPRIPNPARLIISFPNPAHSTARYKGMGCIITN